MQSNVDESIGPSAEEWAHGMKEFHLGYTTAGAYVAVTAALACIALLLIGVISR
ncbi:hypothetical protein [Paraburkholderia pallida]|uniref:hypothetical protein n=1 Tax=Paraburkholderia pallida TaxID=2547399 RepID=UPI001431824E|nr:hypothetical protein [Paraburkholderia pallida]